MNRSHTFVLAMFCLMCLSLAGCGHDPLLESLGLSRCACPPGGRSVNCRCGDGRQRLPFFPDPAPAPQPQPRRPCPGPGPCPSCVFGLH